jgi:hypothetical protein
MHKPTNTHLSTLPQPQFLKHHGNVLSYFVLWDNRAAPFGQRHLGNLHYFLEDDTVCVCVTRVGWVGGVGMGGGSGRSACMPAQSPMPVCLCSPLPAFTRLQVEIIEKADGKGHSTAFLKRGLLPKVPRFSYPQHACWYCPCACESRHGVTVRHDLTN